MEQDAFAAIQNDFFQFLIGNTDFSSTNQHNEKLIYLKGNDAIIPIPYNFDMSGLVDASYAVVSQVQGEVLDITSVRQRLYRGVMRDPNIYEEVRQHYLSKRKTALRLLMN